jgi:HNH endonuclease
MYKGCKVCHKYFKVKPSHYVRRICCSKKCQSEDYKRKMTGSENPNYKGVMNKKISCTICSKQFLKNSYQRDRITCSDDCYKEYVSKKHTGKTISLEARQKASISHIKTLRSKGIFNRQTCDCGQKKDPKAIYCYTCYRVAISNERKCEVCDKVIINKSFKAKTCSRDCWIILKQLHSEGASNPNWKGGVKPENQRIRNHASYKEWRRLVYERDNYTCQDCGKTNCYLHAHHIKSFSQFPELRTDVSNGKTLCVDCHKTYHPSMNIKRYKPQTV